GAPAYLNRAPPLPQQGSPVEHTSSTGLPRYPNRAPLLSTALQQGAPLDALPLSRAPLLPLEPQQGSPAGDKPLGRAPLSTSTPQQGAPVAAQPISGAPAYLNRAPPLPQQGSPAEHTSS